MGAIAKPMHYFCRNRALRGKRIETSPHKLQHDISKFRIGQAAQMLLQATSQDERSSDSGGNGRLVAGLLMFLNERLKISASVGATTHTLIYNRTQKLE